MSEPQELNFARWHDLERRIQSGSFKYSSQKTVLIKLVAAGRKYEESGKGSLAEKMYKRIEEKFKSLGTANSEKSKSKNLTFKKVSDHLHQQKKSETLNYFKNKKSTLPAFEQSFFEEEIQKLEEAGGKGSASLNEIRRQISDSVVRFKTLKKKGGTPSSESLDKTGPYNTLRNVNQFLQSVEDVDALWVQDFKNLYRSLWEMGILLN